MTRIALLIVAAVIGIAAGRSRADDSSFIHPAPSPQTALQRELARCGGLSIEDRAHDTACDAADKAENDRFFARKPVYTPQTVNPFSDVPDGPLKLARPDGQPASEAPPK